MHASVLLYVKVLPSRCVMMMQCPINTWSAGGETVPCTQCPANTASPSTSTNINACVCLPGYKPGASGCVLCQSGEVCPGGTSVEVVVIECPPGATSPAGSDSLADCVCQAGYGKLIMDVQPGKLPHVHTSHTIGCISSEFTV
jgi:hypothetical protein